jgi:quercetin dioxygenase-like cupin family protein
MDVVRGRAEGRPSQARSDTFTGTVYLDPVLASSEASVGNVFFAPSSRTFWHSHASGQVLNVVRGRGLVATRQGEATFIEAADVVYAPAGEVHWHGGTHDTYVLHTAISLGQATWFEEVSSADYQAAHERAAGGESR